MYYYDNSNGVYISREELKNDFDMFKADGRDETYKDMTFERYLELCDCRNGGTLETAKEKHNDCVQWLRFYVVSLKASLADCETKEEKDLVFSYGKDELETYIVELIESRAHL